MTHWYIMRTNSSSTNAFFVSADDHVTLAPGDYAVFCKTSNYEGSTAAYPLLCDGVWSDSSYGSTWCSGDVCNNFNLQCTVADRLALLMEGGAAGTLIGNITTQNSSGSPTGTEWPKDATFSVSLDPASFDSASNDTYSNGCSTAKNESSTNKLLWTWWVSGSNYEYGTPGAANYDCP